MPDPLVSYEGKLLQTENLALLDSLFSKIKTFFFLQQYVLFYDAFDFICFISLIMVRIDDLLINS